ncbi:MAG: DNA polymerase IV [candidate division WS6 bacterium OLB20]|uniref:DNA polymerase IV n=1 Tax=candidate division WS6 bacterium OLB20 TaxID=1617426 RepID=A0A136M077_9BACT|nr:MAG: DNA polymerase IV [candidate division WS6 bacterium OLB20]
MIAVVDCNNFFVSCERVFHPRLRNKPVAVASNNDGCIVARSQEVKALGIPMGAPAFKWKDVLQRHDVKVFSGNFPLYGDMSRRVMSILHEVAPEVEVYSIDEAFLDFEGYYKTDLLEYCREVRAQILNWTGIPVSIGVGPTKTIAKAAADIAKKNPELAGIAGTETPGFDNYLERLPVGDIWGVGRAFTRQLQSRGIFTAGDLRRLSLTWARQRLGVVGQRTLLELKGIRCFDLQHEVPTRKGIIASRSFGTMVEDRDSLAQSIALHATRAGERLRKDGSVAGVVQVVIMTNRHRQDLAQYFSSATCRLLQPSSYTPDLIGAAHRALDRIYRSGFLYKKSMVMLHDITPQDQIQLSMFHTYKDRPREALLMQAVDKLNTRFGRTRLQYAASGITTRKKWHPRREHASQRFTTSWQELPVAYL